MRAALLIPATLVALACQAADRIHLTITAVSHDNVSATTCSGRTTMNCQTYDGGPQTNVVEANGLRYTIACVGSFAERYVAGVMKNCPNLKDGDRFQADYDGKTTMWVYAKKGGNLGKPITVKYHVRDLRPGPGK